MTTESKDKLRIFGVDPGLANTGWGVIEAAGSRLAPIAYGCVSTGADMDTTSRLFKIYNEILAAIRRYGASELAIETVYHKGNDKSAIATAQARGAALVAAGAAGLTVGEYAPAKIKSAVVGTGRADKEQVQYMISALLGLDHKVSPDHAADALAAAICHAHLRKLASLGV